MIPRPFTCCCAVLAIASGFFLYAKKHQTTLLDQQISAIVSETEHVRGQTAMLRTEWALENQPERLAALAVKHAAYLQSMNPTQFVRMADLAQHLPDVVHEPVAVAQTSTPAQSAQTAQSSKPAAAQPSTPVAVTSSSAAPAHQPPPQPDREHTLAVAEAAPAPPHPLPVRAIHPRPVTVAVESPAQAPHVLVAPAPLPPPVAPHDAPIARVAVAPRRQPAQVADTLRSGLHQNPATASADDADPSASRHAALAAASRAETMAPRRLAQNSDDIAPVRHPLPVAAASWHPVRAHRAPMAEGYMEARATSGYTNGSLLSRGSDALPAPVPVTN
ncbi:hypothetical protein [Acetobacter sp.]|uniref:cell division protein FtsL n=1 Tax=Acetobacter sp. TaxID=440 RepID=UPI0039EB7817